MGEDAPTILDNTSSPNSWPTLLKMWDTFFFATGLFVVLEETALGNQFRQWLSVFLDHSLFIAHYRFHFLANLPFFRQQGRRGIGRDFWYRWSRRISQFTGRCKRRIINQEKCWRTPFGSWEFWRAFDNDSSLSISPASSIVGCFTVNLKESPIFSFPATFWRIPALAFTWAEHNKSCLFISLLSREKSLRLYEFTFGWAFSRQISSQYSEATADDLKQNHSSWIHCKTIQPMVDCHYRRGYLLTSAVSTRAERPRK